MFHTPDYSRDMSKMKKPTLPSVNTNTRKHLQQTLHNDNPASSPLSPRQESWESSSSSSSLTTPTTQISITDHHHQPSHDDDDHHLPQSRKPPPPIDPIPAVPPPWILRGDVYFFSFWTSGAQARNLPTHHAYSPLEAQSRFASPETSKPVGGLSMVQILRYKDSPVGPYDELIVVPGSFDWTRRDANGKTKKGRNPKISRIYVSQKHTCYNGRLNWNTPKHLARFEWHHDPDGSTTVKVFPHDTNPSQDTHETHPSPIPFFRATFKPMRFAPRFPFATRWVNYIGFDTTLVMPPLPEGQGSQGELPGTKHWCSLVPLQYSRKTMLGWFDIAQRDEQSGEVVGEYENFWPGLGRWQLGMKMEDAELSFEKPIETWEDAVDSMAPSQPPRSNL